MKKLIILGLFICIVCVAEASKPYQVSGKLKVPSDTLLVISVNTSTGVLLNWIRLHYRMERLLLICRIRL